MLAPARGIAASVGFGSFANHILHNQEYLPTMPSSRLSRLRWVLRTQFGLDAGVALRGVRGTPRFLSDWLRFRHLGGTTTEWVPCLHDHSAPSGDARGEYFWQDLYVAQKVFRASPVRHIDVGSRVDGFVAHVAAFRQLDVVDIRPLASDIPGVRFLQHDMMGDAPPASLQADSVSCLHALEHFGLGRYGDPLNPRGHERGFRNLAAMTLAGGSLYVSVPVGKPRVQFNANRVADPREVFEWADAVGMTIEEFALVSEGKAPQVQLDQCAGAERAARLDYALGIYVLRKPTPPVPALGS
jgi:hypothetical protein